MNSAKYLKPKMMAISFVQGMVLLVLHLSITNQFWPFGHPQWLCAFYSIALGIPLALLLSINENNQQKISVGLAGFTVLLFFCGYYVGLQALPFDVIQTSDLYPPYAITMGFATFIFLIYMQHYIDERTFSFEKLCRYSWRNFLTGILSGLFALAFWGILMLWAALFNLINIDFFDQLFTREWFYYPVLSVAFGFAITIQRSQEKIIDVLKFILQSLVKYLLLVLILVSFIFLLALPFTGLQSLWDTRFGSAIILWLMTLILFFVNAVYHDSDGKQPYGIYIHRFVYMGVALLPVYSAISFYGLTARIDQYGWTVSRCWGMLIWLMLALFSSGYLFAIIKKRDRWIDYFTWINVRMGSVVFAAMVFVNSPLLDFRKVSTASQIDRLNRGEITYDELDIGYFRYQLAAPGYNALQDIKEQIRESHPDIVARIDNQYTEFPGDPVPSNRDSFVRSVRIFPETEQLTPEIMDEIYSYYRNISDRQRGISYIIVADFNDNEGPEYLYLLVNDYYTMGQLFVRNADGWSYHDIRDHGIFLDDRSRAALRKGEFKTITPEWKQLKIGDVTIQIED